MEALSPRYNDDESVIVRGAPPPPLSSSCASPNNVFAGVSPILAPLRTSPPRSSRDTTYTVQDRLDTKHRVTPVRFERGRCRALGTAGGEAFVRRPRHPEIRAAYGRSRVGLEHGLDRRPGWWRDDATPFAAAVAYGPAASAWSGDR